jgi:hypothetical protein
MKLKFRLLSILLACSFVPLLLLLGITYSQIREEAIEKARATNKLLANQVSETLRVGIQQIESVMDMLYRNQHLHDYLSTMTGYGHAVAVREMRRAMNSVLSNMAFKNSTYLVDITHMRLLDYSRATSERTNPIDADYLNQPWIREARSAGGALFVQTGRPGDDFRLALTRTIRDVLTDQDLGGCPKHRGI